MSDDTKRAVRVLAIDAERMAARTAELEASGNLALARLARMVWRRYALAAFAAVKA